MGSGGGGESTRANLSETDTKGSVLQHSISTKHKQAKLGEGDRSQESGPHRREAGDAAGRQRGLERAVTVRSLTLGTVSMGAFSS